MNRALGHFCAHTSKIGPGEPPDDGEMSEMTLPSRHRIRNSKPGCRRPSTLTIKQLMVMRLNIYRLCLLILKTIRIIHLDLQPIKKYSFLEHIINPYHTQA